MIEKYSNQGQHNITWINLRNTNFNQGNTASFYAQYLPIGINGFERNMDLDFPAAVT